MNALLRKEIRQLLPAWGAAMILAMAPAWLTPLWVFGHGDDARALAFGCFALGVLLVSLNSFGPEFSAGTFPQLLVQPTPRHRLWRAKLGALGASTVLTWAAFLVSYRLRVSGLAEVDGFDSFALFCALTVLLMATGGLWTTLMLRQVAAAFWLAIFVPVVILYMELGVLEIIFRITPPLPLWSMYPVLGVYATAGYLWARRLFLHAQDVQWTGGTVALPGWMRRSAVAKTGALSPQRGKLFTLISKELQLQHISWLIATALFVLHVLVVLFRKWDPDLTDPTSITSAVTDFWFVLWFALPFLLGCVALAEERKLGTLESQLCLPVTRTAQIGVKFLTIFLPGVLVSALAPWLIEGAGIAAGIRGSPFETGFNIRNLEVLAAVSAGIALVSFFASSLTRNTLQAMGAAVAIGCGLTGMIFLAVDVAFRGWFPLWGWPLIGYIGIPLIVVTLMGLAFTNSQLIYIGSNSWLRSLFALGLTALFAFGSAAFIYHRLWEKFMSLEPVHGPPRLTGAVRSAICSNWYKTFVLLPDGQLWESTNNTWAESGGLFRSMRNGSNTVEKIRWPVPTAGTFLNASNWSRIAGNYQWVFGIQSDGSLWRIYAWVRGNSATVSKPQRMGADSDWKTILAGSSHFLALKQDGTLWGYGHNEESELGQGPDYITNNFVRIGSDSDWVDAFISGSTSFGVKQDGSVWRWGHFNLDSHGRPITSYFLQRHPEPERWCQDGSDWLYQRELFSSYLVLRRDGTLWAAVPWDLQTIAQRKFPMALVPADGHSGWNQIASSDYGSLLSGLRRDGTLVVDEILRDSSVNSVFGWRSWEPSRYSDWIAVDAQGPVALATDGTLSGWGYYQGWGDGLNLLGPSRKPVWTLNILAHEK